MRNRAGLRLSRDEQAALQVCLLALAGKAKTARPGQVALELPAPEWSPIPLYVRAERRS